MRIGAGVCLAVLGSSVTRVAGKQDDANVVQAERIGDAGEFLGRAWRQARRIGEAVNPDVVAQAEQAWKELAPDLQQATDDILQGKREIQAVRKEAGGIWSEIKQAVSELGGGGGPKLGGGTDSTQQEESSAGLAWEEFRRDAKRAAHGVFGDVFGEVADEVIATFESRLADALSEENVRAGSRLWRRLLDTPGIQLLATDRRLWAGAERAVRRHLSGYMTEKSAMEAERAVNATADFALHVAGLSRNAGKDDHEVFEELSSKLCRLQGAVEKLWPLAVRVLPLLGYEEYAASAESAIRSKVLSRITLTVSASALLGLNPRHDPFLMTVIAGFSLGHLTKDVARNMAALFQRVFMDETAFDQQQILTDQITGNNGERLGALTSPVDLAGELVGGTSTCEEMGQQAFDFFKMVQRALSTEADTDTETSTPTQESLKPPRKLNLDGVVLRAGIWAAAAVENWQLSLGVLVVCLALVASLSGAMLVGCRRRRVGARRSGGSWTRKERKGVKVHGMPQRIVAENREKIA